MLFALLRAGLWEQDVRLSAFNSIDYKQVFRLAREQSVVGLVAAGLEHVIDVKVPKKDMIYFAGCALQIEQKNRMMNDYIAELITQLRDAGINALLVKGQGIAQCYNRPLWRMCGDVDLLLDQVNYEKAKQLLLPLAANVMPEVDYEKHIGMSLGLWTVELHGTMRSGFMNKMDRVVDMVVADTVDNEKVRIWYNGETEIPIPIADNDVVFVFAHILKHLFNSGVGLRQICDLYRLLLTYRKEIDVKLLGERLNDMGVMAEWKTLAVIAVEWLGMPKDEFPHYDSSVCYRLKARRIVNYILDTGNFGNNRDNTYQKTCPWLLKKMISFWRHTGNAFRLFFVYPMDSILVWWRLLGDGLKIAVLELKK